MVVNEHLRVEERPRRVRGCACAPDCVDCVSIREAELELAVRHRKHHDELLEQAHASAWEWRVDDLAAAQFFAEWDTDLDRDYAVAPGEAWVLDEHPEIDWLVRMPPDRRAFYRLSDSRIALRRAFEDVGEHVWELLLGFEEKMR